MLSLSETVTPARGPTGFRSISAARSRASSSNSSSQAWISGSTRAVRARAASVTSTAEISRARTRRAVSSAESSQSSLTLHLGNKKEAIHGGRGVGQELLARNAFARDVLGLLGSPSVLHLGSAFIALELIDVVDDLAELSDEDGFLLRVETEPGESGDFPYF